MILWIKAPSPFDHLKLHESKHPLKFAGKSVTTHKQLLELCCRSEAMTHPHGLLSRRMRHALIHKRTCSCQIPDASACRTEHGASGTLMESWHRSVVHPRWPRVDRQRCARYGMAALIMESNKRTYGPATIFPFILLFSLFSWVNILNSRSESALLSRFCYHSNGTCACHEHLTWAIKFFWITVCLCFFTEYHCQFITMSWSDRN